jgi:hypothetical protein
MTNFNTEVRINKESFKDAYSLKDKEGVIDTLSPFLLIRYGIITNYDYRNLILGLRVPNNTILYFNENGTYIGFDEWDSVAYKHKFVRLLHPDEYLKIKGFIK